jgi:thiamine-monophosphate kinase
MLRAAAVSMDTSDWQSGRYRTAKADDISVSDVGEFGLIARIVARLPQGGGVVLGPGDDAAVVSAPDGRVVVSTDLLVEGRHFRRDWSSSYDVGRKAAAQNLADIVAMGAAPTAVVVGLAAPGDLSLDWTDGFADGLRDECAVVGASVVGGDVVRSPVLSVAVTALGDLGGRAPVTRSGARPGDVVVVAGRLGFAEAGLAMLRAGRTEHQLADAHRRPLVAYAAGLELAAAAASSLVDVSDGLVADLGRVAAMSGVRIELASDDLPLPAELVEAALALGVDPMSWVAGGGDDHAFVATMTNDAALRAVALLADLPDPVPFAQLGRVVAGPPGVVFVDVTPPGIAGHDHFAT